MSILRERQIMEFNQITPILDCALELRKVKDSVQSILSSSLTNYSAITKKTFKKAITFFCEQRKGLFTTLRAGRVFVYVPLFG